MSGENSLRQLFQEFDKQTNALQSEFIEFLKFQSISTDKSYAPEVRKCAEWVQTFLQEAGLEVEVWEGSGHPVIFASWLKAGSSKPTVLIYNHYDVQPVDPLELWQTPPFEPRIEAGEVFARGAQDNKGQCFYVLAAIRWHLRTHGSLPVNIKLCIEGEEECGSQTLSELLPLKKEALTADYLFVVDLGIHDKETPAVTLGVRGIVTMTVELTGSQSDLHSGLMGGIVYNPNRALIEVLARCYAADGSVQIPGFYEDVKSLDSDAMAGINFHVDPAALRVMIGAEPTGGERAFEPLQRAWVRPTLEVNGLSGGYAGEGFKTVIPQKATAKVSCRLVPNQSPERISKLVAEFFKANVPSGISIRVDIHQGTGLPVRTDRQAFSVQTTATVLSEVFQKPCEFILSGGSIPIIAELSETSEAEVVMMGFGLPTDNMHAPNEHFGLDRIRRGFVTIAEVLNRIGER